MNLYERLTAELAAAIRGGELAGGSALPPVREFARLRGIGPSTAARVYASLRQQGLVIGEVGRGTFVRERPMGAGPLSAAARYASLGRSAVALEAQDLRAALKAVAAQPDLAQLTGQASPLGRTSVQRALAAHFVGMGLDVPPGQICVSHGGQAALRLAALAIAQRGQRVAADAITYPGWKLVAGQLGLDLEPIAFDRDGPLPDELERTLRRRRIKALYCMPVAHLPMGWVMPPQRCRAIAELARKHDFALIEDLTYRHLRPKASTGLYRLAPERTWLVGSMSGLLGDGLRFGYLVAPDPNRRVLESLAMSWGLACAPLLIELARHWLEDGTVGAIQARQAEHARALWQAVARTELKTLGSPSTAGWGLWLPAGRGRRAEDLVSRLRRAGVDAIGSEPFSVAAAHPNALLVRLRLLAGEDVAPLARTILDAWA